MAMTPDSATSSYVSPAEFLLRKDMHPVIELVRDDGSVATDLTNDPVLIALLKQASGMLESAAVAGSRYKVVDLQALAGTNAGELIKGIICDLCAHILTQRRWQASEDTLPGYQLAMEFLQRLREGDVVLPFTEVEDASVPQSYNYTQADYDQQQLITRNSRIFGFRGSYGPYQ